MDGRYVLIKRSWPKLQHTKCSSSPSLEFPLSYTIIGSQCLFYQLMPALAVTIMTWFIKYYINIKRLGKIIKIDQNSAFIPLGRHLFTPLSWIICPWSFIKCLGTKGEKFMKHFTSLLLQDFYCLRTKEPSISYQIMSSKDSVNSNSPMVPHLPTGWSPNFL